MISAAVWVTRGVASAVPEFYEPTEEEIQALVKKQEIALELLEKRDGADDDDELDEEEEDGDEEEEGDEDMADVQAEGDGEDDEPREDDPDQTELLKELKMDDYDQESGDLPIFGTGVKGLAFHQDNSEDPFITIEEENDEEDLNDMVLRETDNLILVAKTEDDVSYLEVHVYEEDEDNLYVHHDVMLPALPLAVEWIGFGGKKAKGSFAAVGTFQPEIEIWDLDVVDALYPYTILGEESEEEKKLVKKAKKSPHRHVDSVLGLSWNKAHTNLLASASADKTVKLWDLATSTCIRSYDHHTDKVQSLEWNPAESGALLTGAFDKSVAAFDTRVPNAVSRWKLTADVEAVRWNPFDPAYFVVSTEDGLVTCFDARQNGGKPYFTLSAHDQAVCSLHFNPNIPFCLATGSYDKTVKIWDVKDGKPKCVGSRDLGIGKVFTASFCPDSPFLVAAAGGKGKLTIWDSSQIAALRKHFEDRVVKPGQKPAPPVVQQPLAEQLKQTAPPVQPAPAAEEPEMAEAEGSEKKSKSNASKKKKKNKSKKGK